MTKPTMRTWTDVWHKANQESFKNLYSENAVIFPPHKPSLKGQEAIFNLMQGGLGKVDVIFEPENVFVDHTMAFEHGIFRDVELTTEKTLGIGQYCVTWVFEHAVWKILCHTWTMPAKNE